MIKNFEEFDNVEKEFFYYLGLLSTKFASMESLLIDVIGCLIMPNPIITNTLLEKNSLFQNLELLNKLNKYIKVDQERVQKIYQSISNIRSKRNLFIHGVWKKPYKKDIKYFMICQESKLIYHEEENKKIWTQGKNHKFELTTISNLVWETTDIIVELENIISEFDDLVFQ